MSEGVVDVVGKWPEIEERLRVNGFKDQREEEGKVIWQEEGEKIISRETCEYSEVLMKRNSGARR